MGNPISELNSLALSVPDVGTGTLIVSALNNVYRHCDGIVQLHKGQYIAGQSAITYNLITHR